MVAPVRLWSLKHSYNIVHWFVLKYNFLDYELRHQSHPDWEHTEIKILNLPKLWFNLFQWDYIWNVHQAWLKCNYFIIHITQIPLHLPYWWKKKNVLDLYHDTLTHWLFINLEIAIRGMYLTVFIHLWIGIPFKCQTRCWWHQKEPIMWINWLNHMT